MDLPKESQAFHPGLIKKLILESGGKDQPAKRISSEAVLATGELLRLFVLEARHRAGIEAECEKEGAVKSTVKRTAGSHAGNNDRVLIRADHIAKVAAELLIDFS
jgi:hypothetical protein